MKSQINFAVIDIRVKKKYIEKYIAFQICYAHPFDLQCIPSHSKRFILTLAVKVNLFASIGKFFQNYNHACVTLHQRNRTHVFSSK